MAVHTTLPTTNLTFTDIRDTLNSGGGSVDNTVASAFKSTAKINKWCKNKPMRIAKNFDPTNAEKASANYGLSIPAAKSSAEATKSDNYNYLLPTGGSSQPMRLGDFRGYDTKCVKPIQVNSVVDFNKIFNTSINITCQNFSPTPTSNLALSDFSSLSNYYLAIVLKSNTTGSVYWKTHDTPISATGAKAFTIDQSESGMPQNVGNSYEYYICACSVSKTTLNGTTLSANWLMLPNDTIDDLKGTLNFIANFPITMTPTHIYGGTSLPSNLNSMLPITNYTGTLPSGGGSTYYYPVDTTYTPQIRYTIKNDSNQTITLQKSWFRATFSKTFASTSSVAARTFTIYDTNKTQIDSFSIAAGASKDVIFVFESGVLRMNSSGTVQGSATTGQQISVTITYAYNNINTSKSTIVRFRN